MSLVLSLRNNVILARRYTHLLKLVTSRPLSFRERREAFYKQYWQYAADCIGADIRELGENYLHVVLGERSTFVQNHYVSMDSYLNKYMVDNKPFANRLIRDLGFSAPKFLQYTLKDLNAATRFLEAIEGPCVVKPSSESGGRGVTTNVRNRKRLIEASLAASCSLSLPALMIEEQLPGESYRLLYLDGKLLHGVKRGQCTVHGDGKSTVKELIHLENAKRISGPVITAFTELKIDLELKYTLEDQGLTLQSVPKAGQLLVVKHVSNQNCRRDQFPVEKVHSEYDEFATRLCQELGTHLVGLDVMSTDICQSPSKTGSSVIEINIPPGLHYHELVANQFEFSNVGRQLLDYLLTNSYSHAA